MGTTPVCQSNMEWVDCVRCPTVCHEGQCIEAFDCKCKDPMGEVHEPGSSWKKDDCTTCSCFNNQIQCDPLLCGLLNCGEGFIEASVSGQCCPTGVPEVTTVPVTTTTPEPCENEDEEYGP